MPRSPRPAGPDRKTTHYLDTAEHDQPEYYGERRYYVVCATARCGSTLLCDLLLQSGVLGVPHEYFNPQTHLPALAARLGLGQGGRVRLSGYIQALKRFRTTPGGVFAFKVHMAQWSRLNRQVRVAEHFPDPLFVHITRRDKLAQAVSLELALQTNQWTSRHAAYGTPVYDAGNIAANRSAVVHQDAMWDEFFAANNIEPVRMAYEDLLADAPGQCLRVARAMGVDTGCPFTLASASIARQASRLNEEWIERFKKDTGPSGSAFEKS